MHGSIITSLTYFNTKCYLPGAITLGLTIKSLLRNFQQSSDTSLVERNDSSIQSCIIVDPNQLSSHQYSLLADIYDILIPINELVQDTTFNSSEPILNYHPLYFSKVKLWNLGSLPYNFDKVLYIDCDTMLVSESIFELFNDVHAIESDEIAAPPDIGVPDFFSTGLFLFKPSTETFMLLKDLLINAIDGTSFDDQSILNSHFNPQSNWLCSSSDIHKNEPSWFKLPFTYNVKSSSQYEFSPALAYFRKDVKLYQFGSRKPWDVTYSSTDKSSAESEYAELWWDRISGYLKSQSSTYPETHSRTLLLESLLYEDKSARQTRSHQRHIIGGEDYTSNDSVMHMGVNTTPCLAAPSSPMFHGQVISRECSNENEPSNRETPTQNSWAHEGEGKQEQAAGDTFEKLTQEQKWDHENLADSSEQVTANVTGSNEETRESLCATDDVHSSDEQTPVLPIFPWEFRQRPSPERVFDHPSEYTFADESFDSYWDSRITKKVTATKGPESGSL